MEVTFDETMDYLAEKLAVRAAEEGFSVHISLEPLIDRTRADMQAQLSGLADSLKDLMRQSHSSGVRRSDFEACRCHRPDQEPAQSGQPGDPADPRPHDPSAACGGLASL